MSRDLNVVLIFINKGHHQLIKNLSEKIYFSEEIIKIFELRDDEIPDKFMNYFCGLVFLPEGKWLRMSSPMKIGEYLAAGLSIISLEGINITDCFSKQYECFDLVWIDLLKRKITLKEAEDIIYKIKSSNRVKLARDFALRYYDLNKAIGNYFKIVQ